MGDLTKKKVMGAMVIGEMEEDILQNLQRDTLIQDDNLDLMMQSQVVFTFRTCCFDKSHVQVGSAHLLRVIYQLDCWNSYRTI